MGVARLGDPAVTFARMSLAVGVLDVLGALLTLVSLAFLLASSYLLTISLLGARARQDPLRLSIALLVTATAQRIGIGLLLGAVGLLRFELAFAVEAALAVVLGLRARRRMSSDELLEPARQLWQGTTRRLRDNWPVSLIAAHALGYEYLRGLLRPPLSWDSLSYHLLLSARWLQEQAVFIPHGPIPTNYYGFVPANGSIWLWWWLAPSHSELYVNLAFLPQLALLGLAAGAVARELGARESWPLAGLLTMLMPVVVRYAATQYVDILVASCLVAACFFAIRWLRDPHGSYAVLSGMALGIGAGTKVLGAVYAVALVILVLPAIRSRARLSHALMAALMIALLGGPFYLRNAALGLDPLVRECYATMLRDPGVLLPFYERTDNVWGMFGALVADDRLVDTFLGVTLPEAMELGVGPAIGLLLLAMIGLALTTGDRRRASWLVFGVVVAQLLVWLTVPVARAANVLSSLRFIVAAFALLYAAGVALAETRRMAPRWLQGVAVVLGLQTLMLLHVEMAHGARIIVALVDLSLVAILLSARLRRTLHDRAPLAAGVGLVTACLLAAPLARFRDIDRTRAFEQEYTAHSTAASLFAQAWSWLEHHGDDGTVALACEPGNWFAYPAMGPRLERRVLYADTAAERRTLAPLYPACDPRHPELETSYDAWSNELETKDVRWLHLCRSMQLEYPIERRWADAHPERFQRVYEDPANVIYERR